MDVIADSPSVADWLQGWGTVAGAVFAAIAAVVALVVLQHDRQMSRSSEMEQAAAQARSILALIDAEWQAGSVREVNFSIRNFSLGLILDIDFAFRRADGVAHQGGLVSSDLLRPGTTSKVWKMPLDPEVDLRSAQREVGVIPPDLFETRIVFTDAAGRRWRRDGRAQPVRLDIGESVNLMAWAKAED
jgi:hypothetical protein